MIKNSLGKYLHLKKLCNSDDLLEMLAIDQRPPIFNLIESKINRKASYKKIVEFKGLLTEFLSPYASAILMDPIYSLPNLLNKNKSKGLIVTLEDHIFRDSSEGRLSKNINGWSVEKIKKIGGDAVKVLLWYRPDASTKIKNLQKKHLLNIGQECKKYGIPLLLELLVYPFKNDKGYNKKYSSWENKKHEQVIQSVKEFSKIKYNVDIFKIESPINQSEITKHNYKNNLKIFKKLNKATNQKPWVMLSSGMDKQAFYECLNLAYQSGASGYLAGRSIWLSAFNKYPNLSEVKKDLMNSVKYMKKLNSLTEKKAHSLEKFFNINLKSSFKSQFPVKYKGF